MTRLEAREILGNQPKWALRNMARALRMHDWRNTPEDEKRLAALRALGYGSRPRRKPGSWVVKDRHFRGHNPMGEQS